MFKKLEQVEERYNELENKLVDPDLIQNQKEWQKVMKERADLEEVVEKYRELKKVNEAIKSVKELLGEKIDKDMKELAEMELEENLDKVGVLEDEIKMLLLPKDVNDDKNVMVEIRGGTGGEESALFAAELYRMYIRYAERKRWKIEILYENETGLGGYKEVIFMIHGKGAYSRLKFESGVHRVQRVPDTETNGRIHTSAVTVAVLPEVEDIEVEINQSDLKIDTYRASGAGGQHVNKTESAIRITHLPTGIVVACQNERSQMQNKECAMKMLKSKIYEKEVQESQAKLAQERKTQVGSGDRSERIRTYNFPQGRVTDHRIGLTLYKIEAVLDGEFDEIIDGLITNDRAEKLKAGM